MNKKTKFESVSECNTKYTMMKLGGKCKLGWNVFKKTINVRDNKRCR